jgi:hypothetical protein
VQARRCSGVPWYCANADPPANKDRNIPIVLLLHARLQNAENRNDLGFMAASPVSGWRRCGAFGNVETITKINFDKCDCSHTWDFSQNQRFNNQGRYQDADR